MRPISCRVPVHRFLPFALLFAVACSAAESEQFVEDPPSEVGIVAKGGIDGPAVAVAPFFDGVFPPRTPNSPGGSEWTIIPAFPDLNLAGTLTIASNPGDDRVYVGSIDGLVVAFENRPDVATTETFLDLRDRVALVWEGGLLGFVFHPSFGDSASPNGKAFYVYYSSHCPLDASRDAPDLSACDDGYPRGQTTGFFGTYLRLSRFEVFDGTVIGDPSTEQVLVNVRLYNATHRGGGIAFGSDGYLYLAIGDQRRNDTAQDIVDTFEGGLFRFALEVTDNGDGTWTCPAGTHQPRRIFDTIDEISGRQYCIPDDNPWLDPAGGVYEEYCAIGLRNPHRIAHDPITGRIWEAEPGFKEREEVNILECGNNYGWPFREGLVAGPDSAPPSFLGVLTDPVIDFTRDEAQSIIGGYVYRGSKFPELYGSYLAGDYATNRTWAITLDENTMTATEVFLANFGPGNLVTWGQDNDGEIFLGEIVGVGPLYTLDTISVPVPDAPALISDTGVFSNTALATPSAAWVPYALNQPFWSDGAVKSRFLALPSDGLRDTAAEQIAFSPTGDWSFPIGTVLMKHFELQLDETDPAVTTRLETRFMVLGDDDAWYGLTYRWRANQIEADLLTSEETGDYTIQLSGGGSREQTWYFPSRLDCLSCHRQGFSGALGPKTHQLNGDFTYPSTGRTDNQIRSWNDLEMFSPHVDDASISTFLSSPALGDVTAPLQDRARSWLDSNCAYCHRPGGANAGFDARFTTPFADQGLLWTPVRDDLGNPGTVVIYPGDPILSAAWQRSLAIGPTAMPPLAKALTEQPAVDLLAEWIERIDPSFPNTNSPPSLTDPGDQDDQPGEAISLGLVATDDDGDALYFDAIGLPDGLSLDHDTGAISGTIVSPGATTVIASASDGPAVSVATFEWSVSTGSCGDSVQDSGEECDDGNLADGDGCTSGCVVEFCGDGVVNNSGTEACEPPDTEVCTDVCSARAAQCGDGFLTAPEECEDSNVADGDGCTSGCVVEFCGDGVVNNSGTEACEPPGTASCTDTCAARTAQCGDGFLTAPEQCEDGNLTNGDGCTSGCVLEFCGDGVVNNDGTETCEPPGTALCAGSCTARAAQCGDGFLTPPEMCEDGNVANGDGCTSGCVVEFCGDGVVNNSGTETCEPPGTALCTSACVTRTAQCGDGFLTPPEQCEDSNLANGDGCTSACVVEFCGDGVVNNNGTEACEPPGTASCTDTCSARTAQCGDGFLTAPEQCEDGNVANGDGCTSGCVLEFCGDGMVNNDGIETCEPPGTALCADSCTARAAQCGDGFLTPPEMCEDSNVANGDGCTSGCALEFCGDGVVNNSGTEACEPPGTASCTNTCATRTAQCGDGFLTAPEQCEDGNVANGDGCTSGCVLEFCGDGVVNNNGGEACEPPGTALCADSCTPRAAQCGDGFLTPPEMCEDGNVANGDGCTSGCAVEFCGDGVVNNGTEACEPPGTSSCTDTCATRTAQCGDGFLTPPEQCEDGNTNNGDGCSGICTVEVPPACGDGNTDPGEQCDDGNLVDADGCTSNCALEFCGDGLVNNGGTEACEPPGTSLCTDGCAVRIAVCGDGFQTPPEQCEDGNLANGDGCTSACVMEFCGDGVINGDGAESCEPPGTASCTGVCTTRTAQCGDGFLTLPEQCEDENLLDGDGCTSGCVLEVCGDGVINNNGAEACEPPGTALCTSTCTIRTAQCGDGLLTPPEQCEDGNVIDGDGCTSSCVPEVCGDGVVNNDGAEACEPPSTALCDDSCVARTAQCGDGFLTPPEQCEDGNLGNGDGCTSTCVREFCGDGVVNNSGAEECEPPGTGVCTDTCTIRSSVCGDGLLTPPELCEDGNLVNGDGCTSSCVPEVCGDGVVNNSGAEACEPPGTASCTQVCTIRAPSCGDGFLTPPEQCEDSNLVGGDGCTSSCLLEVCGDGVVNNSGAEACEPPGTALCTDTCTAREALCGDGLMTPPEQCEDGNLNNGDGCTSSCVSEFCGDGVVNNNGTEGCEPPGTGVCTDACTFRASSCGDGLLTPPEQCEDGNLVNGDGCTSGCVLEFCGDGVVNNGGAESCEPPGTSTCTDSCVSQPAGCGDGTMDEGEECDDGNVDDGDGCSAACELEPPPMPDGGLPDGGAPEAGVPDAGTADGGLPDGGIDGADSGAGCSVQKGSAPIDFAVMLGLFVVVSVRRRRHD